MDESELDGSVKCVRYIGEERASRKTKKQKKLWKEGRNLRPFLNRLIKNTNGEDK